MEFFRIEENIYYAPNITKLQEAYVDANCKHLRPVSNIYLP